MKPFTFIALIIIAVFTILGVVLVLQPTPLQEPVLSEHDQAIAWLEEDIQIHREFLAKPEEIIYAPPYTITGNYEYHQRWIDNFTEIIKYINREPNDYTKQGCINLLKTAQATHAGIVSCDYAVLKWHYDWFERYNTIIAHIEKGY